MGTPSATSRSKTTTHPVVLVVAVILGLAVSLALILDDALGFGPLIETRVLVPHARPHADGRLGLRTAMIYDVLHQRYASHGEDWHIARIAASEARIASLDLSEPSAAALIAFDDIAVSCDRLKRFDDGLNSLTRKQDLLIAWYGRPDSAEIDAVAVANQALRLDIPYTAPTRPRIIMTRVDWLNDLLEAADATDGPHRQSFINTLDELGNPPPPEKLDDPKAHWYSLYANRGTLKIHALLYAQDLGNRHAVAEARDDIALAVQLNPNAHFGREPWQLHILCQLASGQTPTATMSLFGTPLLYADGATSAEAPTEVGLRYRRDFTSLYGTTAFNRGEAIRIDAYQPVLVPHLPVRSADGIHYGLTPADQIALAAIGMWTYGGGPNPFSALMLGQVSETLGQRQLAFFAYQRALGMQARWPAPVRDALTKFCQARCDDLTTATEASTWSDFHRADLAAGEAAQRQLHEAEATLLAAGVAYDDPQIAALANTIPRTTPGAEQWLTLRRRARRDSQEPLPALLWGLSASIWFVVLLRVLGRLAPSSPSQRDT